MLAPFTITTPWALNVFEAVAGRLTVTPNLTVTQTQETDTSLEFHLEGTLTMASFGDWAVAESRASHYFAFVADNVLWNTFPFGSSHVETPLPTALDGPTSATQQAIFEIRVDRDSGDEHGKVTLWVLGQGTVLNGVSSAESHTVTLDVLFNRPQPIEVPASVVQTWDATRSDSLGTRWVTRGQYGEITTLPSTDYRPSAVSNGTTLLSCNRTGGARRIYGPDGWFDIASNGSTPPLIRNASALVSQVKTGQE